ncbi:hypothetical protein [Streptomyces sp. URMC 129]|uniref:hypothetical protein n=1 Tax=Streptomyces sp. URMC 129 TaxID=3423407 RepID=UPI003F1D82A8
MGVFAWLKGRGQDRKQPSGTAAGEAEAAAPEQRTPAAEAAEGDGVGIPQQSAAEAAGREAGEEARQ